VEIPQEDLENPQIQDVRLLDDHSGDQRERLPEARYLQAR
jgi:hypothetical protein